MSAIKRYCKVIKNIQIGRGLFDMELFCPEMAAAARPGQFLHITCGEGSLLRRPISVCDIGREVLRVVYEVKGEGTEFLSRVKCGEMIDVLGPAGRGFDLSLGGERVMLIGGGIGIFPLLPLAKFFGARATAMLGFRNAEAVVLTREFDAACHNVHVATDDGSLGYNGFVTDMAENAPCGAPSVIYACGPKPMLKNVKALAERLGVSAQLSMEERMGCGIGACLVCACKTVDKEGGEGFSHVCKDGPVFNADEVIF